MKKVSSEFIFSFKFINITSPNCFDTKRRVKIIGKYYAGSLCEYRFITNNELLKIDLEWLNLIWPLKW